MLSDSALIGWLCIFDLQTETEGDALFVPNAVREEWHRRGWAKWSDDGEPDWKGHRTLTITDAGRVLVDLEGPAWGINTIPQESEA